MHTTIEIANAVLTKMQALVSGEVLSYLESVLMSELRGIELEVNALSNVEDEASKYMERFLAAKTIEGCSLRPSGTTRPHLQGRSKQSKNQLSGLVQMTYEHT